MDIEEFLPKDHVIACARGQLEEMVRDLSIAGFRSSESFGDELNGFDVSIEHVLYDSEKLKTVDAVRACLKDADDQVIVQVKWSGYAVDDETDQNVWLESFANVLVGLEENELGGTDIYAEEA